MARKTLIQSRRDTAANWTAVNPTLAAGESGFETDTGKLKVGDGATAWNALGYIGPTPAGAISVTDGVTTVNPASTVDFVSGATVANGGGGVAQVTVTGASGALARLFDSTLVANAASIDTGAGGIAAGYAHLLVVFLGRNQDATAFGAVAVTVNNDGTASYDTQYTFGNNVTTTSGVSLAQTSWGFSVHGSGGSANYPGIVQLWIPCYALTTFYKIGWVSTGRPDATAANGAVEMRQVGWRNTAAISRLKVASAAGNLLAGSRLTIYGMS